MSLPRFLNRVIDATAPVLGGLDRDAVLAKLEASSLTLVAGDRAQREPEKHGLLLAANLLARLYPRIRLEGPSEVVRAAKSEIIRINPGVNLSPGGEPTSATLVYEAEAETSRAVSVHARGWNVYVDTTPGEEDPPSAAAALIAAVLGVGEAFRVVFVDELSDQGRHGAQPGSFNAISLGAPIHGLPTSDTFELGGFRLVGCGAIGQAAALALACSGATGTLTAIDHEKVTLSNLQRYVLTGDTEVGAIKVFSLRERLQSSNLTVVPIEGRWNAAMASQQLPTLVALDSAEARIGVQASLPGPIYNAWTQPADIGWSRHEHFGDQPCLACLYWPRSAAPSRHEQIASALRQHPLRVLAYLVHGLPVGLPVPPGGVPAIPGVDPPADADRWLQTPIIEDIAGAGGASIQALAPWRQRPIADLYRDGICGGALLHLNVGQAPREVLVPLAHQSALAGLLLATEFLASKIPALAEARAQATEGRFDVLAGLPQVLARPRRVTEGCLCQDDIFRGVYGEKSLHEAAGGDPGEQVPVA